MMRLNVKILGGEECDVNANPGDSVEHLKREVEVKLKLGKEVEQKLLFKGKTLQDGTPLSDYKLIDGSKLNLVIKRRDNKHVKPTGASQVAGRVAEAPVRHRDQASVAAGPVLEDELVRVLRKHFNSTQDAKKVAATFIKLYHQKLASLSLDDIERICKEYNSTCSFRFM